MTDSGAINRLRWHLHELDPAWQPPARSLWRPKHLGTIEERLLAVTDGLVARLARSHAKRCRELSTEIQLLDKEIAALVTTLAPALLEICGCATLTAAKILGETTDARRFLTARLRPAQRTAPHHSRSGQATGPGTGSAGSGTAR